MANNYTKAAFCIEMSRSDAAVVRDAVAACDLIQDYNFEADLANSYQQLGPEFKLAFPARDGNVFETFYKLFDDPVYPTFGCDIDYGLPNADNRRELIFSGTNFGIEEVANLLFACKSAHPCGFEYSYDCDKLRIGEFGGGAVIITADGISYHSTAEMLQSEIAEATA